jgi:phosphatidylserine/phosphatidylglycerophosphate/cardiolipin synthase-like enzyme
MIVVDNQAALISSQNWSNAAVLENREAGLLLSYPEMARYYAAIFESDWRTAVKKLPTATVESIGPESLRSGKLVEVNYGDYAYL